MTTNVYDARAAVLTSDSRWSANEGNLVAYVDDTNYDKIVHDKRLAFLFAGDLPEIDLWKTWVMAGRQKDSKPALADAKMQVIQIDVQTGKVVFQSHNFANTSFGVAIRALFAGTGAGYAKVCWDVNKCAMTAIVSAVKEDKRSGGNTMYFKRIIKESNVKNSASAADLQAQLKDRGFLMDITNTEEPISLKDAANDSNHPGNAMAKAVMSGGMQLSAPFPGMDEPWTNAKKVEFEAALALYDED